MLDAQNGSLAAFEFDDRPDWFILGALGDRFIDALTVRYELDDLDEGETREISFSVLVYAFEFEEVERWTETALKQQFDSETNLPVQQRDFPTYIEEYNIKFVVVDTQKVLSNNNATPALDRVYDNGRSVVYATKR